MRTSAVRNAVSKFAMPAMSPTMTEGGIASWKKQEGESFQAGDVLLEIVRPHVLLVIVQEALMGFVLVDLQETDKATIDVEAQDDGVLGKILVRPTTPLLVLYGLIFRGQAPDGAKNIPVGKTIGLLAEEGDDISNLEVPADDPAPSPKASQPTPEPPKAPTPSTPKSETPASAGHHVPHHSRPLFPSVLRLIQEHSISQGDVDKINGTGVRGMLTKGDVLTHLGLASGPSGTYRETPPPDVKTTTKTDAKGKEEIAPLDGLALRRLIVGNMLDVSIKARAAAGTFHIYVRG